MVRRRTKDDIIDHPDFFFVIGAFCFNDFVDFGGVLGGFTGGVEIELAFFLGEKFALESEAVTGNGGLFAGDLEKSFAQESCSRFFGVLWSRVLSRLGDIGAAGVALLRQLATLRLKGD